MFRAITVRNFVPFGPLDLQFPPPDTERPDMGEVHLFTGVNGTGKTRLLALIAALLGNTIPLTKRTKATPLPIEVAVATVIPKAIFPVERFNPSLPDVPGWNRAAISPPSLQWFSGGGSWASTVAAFAYYGTPYVGDVEIKTLVSVPRPQRAACLSFDHQSETPPLIQAIGNLKVQAAMDSLNSTASTRAMNLVSALESALTQITGNTFRFGVETNPAVLLYVSWGQTKLPIDALPDGLRSIIGWMVHALVMMDLWLQGKADPRDQEAVFLLDEIESHLHPAWQRRILPAFQHLFPKAQIFIATHSPFIISSLTHGWIYPFKIAEDGKVRIDAPVSAKTAESYISVVEDIMGVKEWFDVETEGLLSDFRAQRDRAYKGDDEAAKTARELGQKIGSKSMELDFLMGKELIQMDRQLAKSANPK